MGLMEKILEPPKVLPVKNSTKEILRPTKPCGAGCKPPYGRHFWRDTYGQWHCTECDPPAAYAMVKEEFLLPREGEVEAATEDFFVADGFELTAILPPGGKILFSPNATQADRRQIIEAIAWFERNDAREERPKKLMRTGFGKN
jgi:hypothetical protein